MIPASIRDSLRPGRRTAALGYIIGVVSLVAFSAACVYYRAQTQPVVTPDSHTDSVKDCKPDLLTRNEEHNWDKHSNWALDPGFVPGLSLWKAQFHNFRGDETTTQAALRSLQEQAHAFLDNFNSSVSYPELVQGLLYENITAKGERGYV